MTRASRNAVVLSFIAAVTLVAVCGWFLFGRGQPSAKPRTSAGASDPTTESVAPSVPSPRPAPPPLAASKPAMPIAAPTIAGSSPPESAVPRGALRAALEREVPDRTAAQAEERIRAIFQEQPNFDVVFRHVLCTRSVCRIDLRWSPELSDAYNGGLIKVVEEFSREIAFEPGGELNTQQMPIPMNIYIARKGHSVESLLAEEAAGTR